MKIVLLRHGKPNISEHGRIRANEVHQWIELYNSVGLCAEHMPSAKSIEIANDCNTVICSDLTRSIESAQALGVKEINLTEPLFREMGLPYSSFPPLLKLPPNLWVALFRAVWFFGYSSNSESFKEAKLRATEGANKLKTIAEKNDSVLLVGHGFINQFIAKNLLSSGWKGSNNPGRKYWEFGVYEYSTA